MHARLATACMAQQDDFVLVVKIPLDEGLTILDGRGIIEWTVDSDRRLGSPADKGGVTLETLSATIQLPEAKAHHDQGSKHNKQRQKKPRTLGQTAQEYRHTVPKTRVA